jgi:hypothetical protein
MDDCGVSGSGLGILVLYYLPPIIILGDQVFSDTQSHQRALMDGRCKAYALYIGLLGNHSFLLPVYLFLSMLIKGGSFLATYV